MPYNKDMTAVINKPLGGDFWPCELKGHFAVSNTDEVKKHLNYIEKYGSKIIRQRAREAISFLYAR